MRLSFLVPLTPWPVLLWLESQGSYMWSTRHSAEPLIAVKPQALVLCLLATLAGGCLLIPYCRVRPQVARAWFALATLNGWILWEYINLSAVVYA